MVVLKMLEVCIAHYSCSYLRFKSLHTWHTVTKFTFLSKKYIFMETLLKAYFGQQTVVKCKQTADKLIFLCFWNKIFVLTQCAILQLFWLLREGEALTWVEKVKNHFHLSQSAWREDLTPLKMTCPTIPYCRTLMTVTSMNNRARIYLNNGQTFFRIRNHN